MMPQFFPAGGWSGLLETSSRSSLSSCSLLYISPWTSSAGVELHLSASVLRMYFWVNLLWASSWQLHYLNRVLLGSFEGWKTTGRSAFEAVDGQGQTSTRCLALWFPGCQLARWPFTHSSGLQTKSGSGEATGHCDWLTAVTWQGFLLRHWQLRGYAWVHFPPELVLSDITEQK